MDGLIEKGIRTTKMKKMICLLLAVLLCALAACGTANTKAGGETPAEAVEPASEAEAAAQEAAEGEDSPAPAAVNDTADQPTPAGAETAAIHISLAADGPGSIALAPGEEVPAREEEFPFRTGEIELTEPETRTFAAWPDEGWHFVKWTKNGEDYAEDDVITVLLDESADFVAVFASDSEESNSAASLAGTYAVDRATATVETEGENGVRITIEWGDSAWSLARWVMSGVLDEETMRVTYADCISSQVTYAEDDSVEELVMYINGTGSVQFPSDNTLVWLGDQSEQEDLTFERIDPAGLDAE